MEKHPRIAVDLIIEHPKGILVIRRANPPFKGDWALPGGFVEYGETLAQAGMREAKEETGLDVEILDLVGIYSDPGRDPRGHVISICFRARALHGDPFPGAEASQIRIVPRDQLGSLKLAFDHSKMIQDYILKFKRG